MSHKKGVSRWALNRFLRLIRTLAVCIWVIEVMLPRLMGLLPHRFITPHRFFCSIIKLKCQVKLQLFITGCCALLKQMVQLINVFSTWCWQIKVWTTQWCCNVIFWIVHFLSHDHLLQLGLRGLSNNKEVTEQQTRKSYVMRCQEHLLHKHSTSWCKCKFKVNAGCLPVLLQPNIITWGFCGVVQILVWTQPKALASLGCVTEENTFMRGNSTNW